MTLGGLSEVKVTFDLRTGRGSEPVGFSVERFKLARGCEGDLRRR